MTKNNTVREKFANGMLVEWGSEYVCNQGKRLVACVKVNGLRAEAVFEVGNTLVFKSIFGLGQKVGKLFAEGLNASAGSWSYQAGTTAGEKVVVRRKSSDEETRKYDRTVYFWTRKGKGGKVLYCHSHTLCETPLGRQFYEEWAKNPSAFMERHPELCSQKRTD